jgi:hypothetical protein
MQNIFLRTRDENEMQSKEKLKHFAERIYSKQKKYEWEIMECEAISKEIIMPLLYEPFMLFCVLFLPHRMLARCSVCI